MEKIKHIIKSPLTYKILVDIFLLMLITTVVFVLMETFIPGLISAYISPFILFGSIFAIVIFIAFISHEIDVRAPIEPSRKTTNIFISILFAILIGFAGFKYGFLTDLLIVTFCIVIFILLHHLVKDIVHD